MLVPRGAFRTASISLRSNMRLHLETGAGLYGSTDPKDYTISFQWFGGRQVYNVSRPTGPAPLRLMGLRVQLRI